MAFESIRRVSWCSALALVSGCGGVGPCNDRVVASAVSAHEPARYYGTGMQFPLGALVAIRTPEATCLVRFTSICRAHDAKPPSYFSNGRETILATYDISTTANGGQEFAGPGVTWIHRELAQGPSFGLTWHSATTRGAIRDIACGERRILWLAPAGLAFASLNAHGSFTTDRQIQLALLGDPGLAKLAIEAPGLVWYGVSDRQIKPPQLVTPARPDPNMP